MPFINIWIHIVWSTKKRKPYLRKEIRQEIFNHIKENAKEKEIFIDFINGYTDHVHCLLSLGSEQSISKIMQLLKGESSFWINKNKLVNDKFEWQNDYYAASVSYSHVDRVREYIKNQESHHQKKTFEQEYDDFVKKQGFKKFKDNE